MLTPHVTRLAGAGAGAAATATATTPAPQRPDQLRMGPAEPAAERPMRQHRDKAGSARAACLALCLILVACLAGTAHANVSASVLGSGGKLNDGGTLTSPNGQYTLTMQGDGNLVETTQQGRVIWATMTFGGTGSYAAMQADGNFVVYSAAGQAQYSAGTNGHGVPTLTSAAGSYLALQNDANLVVYSATGQPKWATYQFNNQLMPGDKLAAGDAVYSPNDEYRLVMQPDGNLVEYNNTTSTAVWATYTVGQGNYAAMQTDGNLVVYGSSIGRLWNSQTGGHSGAFLVVQSDSNIVVYDNGQPLWSSGGSSPTALKVAALAESYNGQTEIPSGFAATYHIGPHWSGYCESFVALVAYSGQGRYTTAYGDYLSRKSAGLIHTGVPPRGAIVYWDPGHDNIGHIGISLGGGQEISTYGFAGNDYPIQEHPYTTFANYLGWAMPY